MNWIHIIPVCALYCLNYMNHFNLVIFVALDPHIVKIAYEILLYENQIRNKLANCLIWRLFQIAT